MAEREHELKTWPEYYEPVVKGMKRFEFRLNDRGFAVGDVLRLREWRLETREYTGRESRFRVTYKMGVGFPMPDYVIMSIEPLESTNA